MRTQRPKATAYLLVTLVTLAASLISATASAQQPLLPPSPPPEVRPNQTSPVSPGYAAPELLPPNRAPANGEELPVVHPPGVWTLQQAEMMALQFNPILQRSLAQIDNARGLAQQASLYPNPRMDSNNPEVFAGQNSQYNFGFMQDIVVKGKLRLDRAAANEVLMQRQHGLTVDRFTLLLAVRQQFYTVLAEQRRVEVLDEMRKNQFETVRVGEQRVKAAVASELEVLLLRTTLQRAEAAYAQAATTLQADRRALAAIIGRPDLRIDRVVGDLMTGFLDFNGDFLRQFVVEENAQVQMARREIERNEFLLRRARVEPYPNVRVGPAYANNIQTSPGTQQFWLTLQFDIPVWNRNQGNIVAAQANLADAIASLGVLQNELLTQAEEVLGRYLAARQLEEKLRTEILPTSREALRITDIAYRAGELDIATLLQAQRNVFEASLNYVETLENVWTTAAEISKLLQLEKFP
jgi:cobalt-zinc-cadmium efflux system outer membrane protein